MDDARARELLAAERKRIVDEVGFLGLEQGDDLSTTDLADSASDLYQNELDQGRLDELRTRLAALERFPVAAAVEGHGDEVLDATAYAARLNELRQAADLVDARGPAAVDDAADDPELRELVEFLLVGAGARQ